MSFDCFFFFKQKTAYELRISDWSSDVCSSDLRAGLSDAMPISPISRQNAITHDRSMTTTAAKPRRSQAARSAATRAKVIAAARDILCAQGYSGATMHAIRDAPGMSLGATQQTGRASWRGRGGPYV